MTDESATPSTGTSTAPVERHIEYALRLAESGTRPTVDLLVAKQGGSRTTAQKALAVFWSERLPALLGAREYEHGAPDEIRETVGALWRSALVLAEERANNELAEQRRQLAVAQAEINGTLAGLADERAQSAKALEHAASRIAELEGLRETQQANLADLTEQIEQHKASLWESERLSSAAIESAELLLVQTRATLDDARTELRDTQARAATAAIQAQSEMVAAREQWNAERAALLRGHEQAMGALKDAYHDGEQRLRVDLDTARTQASTAGKSLEKARTDLATLQAETKSLKDQLKQARARPARKRAAVAARR